jgi:uncharacterized repeat protein (TIGR01451 family)
MAERWLSKALMLTMVVLLLASTASAQTGPGEAGTLGSGATQIADEAPLYSLSGPAVYLLRLVDPPLASYRGEIPGLEATSPAATGAADLDVDAPASQAYSDYLAQKQDEILEAMQLRFGHPVEVLHTYSAAYNGLAVRLTGQEAVEVASLPGIADIQPDFVRYPDTDVGPAWIGAPGVWDGSGTGGLPATLGEGIIVGVIDTGINFDHPSFADVGEDGYDHTNPFGSNNYKGLCSPAKCNDKLVGAWDFTGDGNQGEDDDGHGSHTASTAAGNVVIATVAAPTFSLERTISGVAPHANIIAYDACIVDAGCPGSALLAAIDQAVTDGVDVINYSIGGGPYDPWDDPDSQAFLAARDAGIFVATSAGNEGPAAGSVGSPANAPWLLTVGAVTHNRKFANALTGMSGGGSTPPPDLWGESITSGYGPAPIVHAKDFGDALCLNPFPAGTWTHGEIVVCDRGQIARVDKGSNVLHGGAGGFVLANTAADGEGLSADAHYLPAVHIGYAAAQLLLAWLDTGSGHMATIAGTTLDLTPTNGDIMADFSSRGPNLPVPGVLKPDVVAPGVAILAASMNGIEFESMGGTSMASPHAAGAAALLTVLHPDWTPAEMQSALMTTAVDDTVRKEDGTMAADPFDDGAGRIDVSRAAQASLVLDETHYAAADPSTGGDPTDLNLASLANDDCQTTCDWSRTLRSTLDTSSHWTVSVTGASPGLVVTVTPSSFDVASMATTELQIEADTTGFNAALNGVDGWGFASIVLESTDQVTLHLPLAVKKPATSAPLLLSKEPSALAVPANRSVVYTIQVTNRETVANTYSLTDTLPAGVEYVAGSATGGLVYDPLTRQLTWQGEIGPRVIEYTITEVDPLPYVNLGDRGFPGVCATYFPPPADCHNKAMPWDLGSDSYTFYGETLSMIWQTSNGMMFGPDGWLGLACPSCNQFLPEPTELNQVLAGLWRHMHPGLGGQGEFYAAFLDDWLANPADRVLYANWQDVIQYGDPTITSRHAIAIVLDGQSEPAGRIYYVYDDITGDLTTNGYTVGVENQPGDRGTTWAFAQCTGGSCIPHPAQGSPPADGTTLRLDPVTVGSDHVKTFTYRVRITAAPGTVLTNRVEVTSSSSEPEAASMWAIADVSVTEPVPTWYVYLPSVFRNY